MNPIRVEATRARARAGAGKHPATPVSTLEDDLTRVQQLAQLMDAQFQIAGIRIGWDSIIGLVPVLGDIVTAAIAVYPLHIARKHRLGRLLQARMATNILIDATLGAIPLIGDLFDIAFKANLKNAQLLARAADRRASSADSRPAPDAAQSNPV